MSPPVSAACRVHRIGIGRRALHSRATCYHTTVLYIYLYLYIYIFHKNDIHKLNTFGAFRQISGCFAQGVLVVVGTNADRDGSGGTDWWSRNCGTGMYTHYFFFSCRCFFLVCVCVCGIRTTSV